MKRVGTWYRVGLGLLVLVCLAKLFYDSVLVQGNSGVNFFSYFTNLSNILGALLFIYCGLRGDATSRIAAHPCPPRHARVGPLPSRGAYIGMRIRNVVRRGRDSHSIVPPWSPMIFATKASPRPVPAGLVVMNGSKR